MFEEDDSVLTIHSPRPRRLRPGYIELSLKWSRRAVAFVRTVVSWRSLCCPGQLAVVITHCISIPESLDPSPRHQASKYNAMKESKFVSLQGSGQVQILGRNKVSIPATNAPVAPISPATVHLSQPSRLTLTLQQHQDIILLDRSLKIRTNTRKAAGRSKRTLTFRMIERDWSSMNSTRTCVTPPLEPVRPRTLVTLASLTGWAFMVMTFLDYGG
jgi:hypothetical protein